MNFGDIYDAIIDRSLRSVLEGTSVLEARKVPQSMARYIKLKEPLKKMFFLYTNIRDTRFQNIDEARYFLDESLALVSSLDYDDIMQYNKLLAMKFGIAKTDINRETQNFKLNENISTLVKSVTWYDRFSAINRTRAYSYIINHLMSEKSTPNVKSESIFEGYTGLMPAKTVINRTVVKFNNEYGKLLSPEEKRAFNILCNCNEHTIKKELLKLRSRVNKTILEHKNDIPDDLTPKLLEAFQKLKISRSDGMSELTSKYISTLEISTELNGVFKGDTKQK